MPSAAASRPRPTAPPSPGAAPSWAAGARGAWLWDAHGQRRLDMSGARGAVLLGHADPEVEAAVAAGDGADGAEAAALLAAQLPAGEGGVRFAADAAAALAFAVASAVRATDRPNVLTLAPADPLAELAARLAAGDVAAVVVEVAVLQLAQAQALRALTAASGTLLVLDETVSGLRRGPGGAQRTLGVRADLCLWGAGLANGRALAAVTGAPERLRDLPDGPSPDAASLCAAAAVLRRLARDPVATHLAVRGAEVAAELDALLAGAGGTARTAGDPTWIELEIDGPDAPRLRRRFVAQLAARGVHAPGPLAVGDRHEDAEVEALLDAVAGSLHVLADASRAHAA